VAFLEWLDPPYSCGHWTPELIRLAGGIDGLSKEGERSRALDWHEVVAWDPEVIVVACCGFDVDRTLIDLRSPQVSKHLRALAAFGAEKLHVIDGSQYFSRPGPRLVDSLELLAHALHPDVHPLPNGLARPVSATSEPDVSLEAVVLHASE
jgi:iron complex transport system substrate-binding protein